MSTKCAKPRVFGAGLFALDLVMSASVTTPVKSWAGGTCGNVLSILAYLGWESFPIARMNGDPASERVRADMQRWGVRLDFAACEPTSHTPIIIQEIRRGRDGAPTHRFSWACPHCGEWLPGFKAVTLAAVDFVAPHLAGASVFFMDRLSRAALTLAAKAAEEGAIVMFEPSGRTDPKMFGEAMRLAHIVKYADQRLADGGMAMQEGTATLVEVQTLGIAGLRYRHRLDREVSDWQHLPSVVAPQLVDSCGSGDWCTAGLLAKIAGQGLDGLRVMSAEDLEQALRHGQALASWNCAFEGARGGMYAVERERFAVLIDDLLAGSLGGPLPEPHAPAAISVNCPACPPTRNRGTTPAAQRVRTRRKNAA